MMAGEKRETPRIQEVQASLYHALRRRIDEVWVRQPGD